MCASAGKVFGTQVLAGTQKQRTHPSLPPCRKLQPQATGPLHLAIVTALTFFGGFVGHFVTYSWTAELETYAASLGEDPDLNYIEWRVRWRAQESWSREGKVCVGCADLQAGFGEGDLQGERGRPCQPSPICHIPTPTPAPGLVQNAALASFGFFVGGLGFPFLLAVFLPNLYR